MGMSEDEKVLVVSCDDVQRGVKEPEGEKPAPKPEKKKEGTRVALTEEEEKKLRDAVKLAEDNAKRERDEREKLLKKGRDEKVALFAEQNKDVIIPALLPKFKALAESLGAGVVKLDDKETGALDLLLDFMGELRKAPKLKLGSLHRRARTLRVKTRRLRKRRPSSRSSTSVERRTRVLRRTRTWPLRRWPCRRRRTSLIRMLSSR